MKTNLFLLTGMAAIAAMSMLAVGCSGSSSEEGKKPTTDSKDLAIVLRPDASYAWTANDAVNVFQAVDGSTAYVSEGKFTIASGDISTNTFRGTLTEAPDKSKSYRYYVLYPYLSSSSSPAEVSSCKALRTVTRLTLYLISNSLSAGILLPIGYVPRKISCRIRSMI